MKQLIEYLNEDMNVSNMKKAFNSLTPESIRVIADIVEDWFKNPNKEASFYKGDGGQFVNNEKDSILEFTKKVHENADV